MRARIFEVVQYECNPKTGEPLNFSEENIKAGVDHKSIKQWAYIAHTRDPYTQHDWDEYVDKYGSEPSWKVGDHKAKHWHVVCSCQSALELDAVAKWFDVPVQQIEVPRGRDAFLDKVEYLTHERTEQQALGKSLYDDSEVTANFDFRKELTERAEKKAKYGRDVNEKDEIRYKVLYEGMTLRQLCHEDPIAYQNDYSTLDKFRFKYITERAPMPRTRINYYVCGRGGVGKGLICRALARSLYPELEDDDDIFFEVGAKGAPFEGYDGQPVIIWNDRRAYDLLQELNGRGNVFNVFDTHPTRGRQNIKYSSICLCNEVNIVNSVQEYEEFLDGLAGEYKDKNGETQAVEDKGQSYRRFPFIIPLHENDFDLLMNKGFYYGTREYEQYIEYRHIRGNMQRIAEQCGANERLAKQIQTKTVQPVANKHAELIKRMEHETRDEAEILKMFEDYGKTQEQIDAEHSEKRGDTI
jgi:hypothetical protein